MKKIVGSLCIMGILVSCGSDDSNQQNHLPTAAEHKSINEIKDGVTISGIKLPKQLEYRSHKRKLVGAGTRVKFFVNVYVLGLYMENPSKDPITILNSDEAMSVRMRVISSLLTTEVLVKYIREGFQRSAGEDAAKFEKEIDLICQTFTSLDSYEVGDAIDIQYTPGIGITASINSVPYNWALGVEDEEDAKDLLFFTEEGEAAVPTLAFKKALFGIWFSDDPVDLTLKEEILK